MSWPLNSANERCITMGRINSGHTLAQAISLKSNQSDISSKTVSKLSKIIKGVRNCGDVKLTLKTLEQAMQHVDSIKSTPAQVKMQKLLLANYPAAALAFAVKTVEANNQPDYLMGYADDRLMSSMVNAESSLHRGIELKYFCSTDDLTRFVLEKTGPYKGQAVVKMVRSNEKAEPHFAAVDIRISSNGLRSMVIYEPAFLHGDKNAPVNHGFSSLVEGIKFQTEHLKVPVPKVGFVEINGQKSQFDCAIFALSTAIQNFKDESVTESLLKQMDAGGQTMTRFYDESASEYIKNIRIKVGVTLSPNFHKHGHSISTLKEMDDSSVNKRNESVSRRAEQFKVQRDGRAYSNSIEHKRIDYYQHVVGQLKNNP